MLVSSEGPFATIPRIAISRLDRKRMDVDCISVRVANSPRVIRNRVYPVSYNGQPIYHSQCCGTGAKQGRIGEQAIVENHLDILEVLIIGLGLRRKIGFIDFASSDLSRKQIGKSLVGKSTYYATGKAQECGIWIVNQHRVRWAATVDGVAYKSDISPLELALVLGKLRNWILTKQVLRRDLMRHTGTIAATAAIAPDLVQD